MPTRRPKQAPAAPILPDSIDPDEPTVSLLYSAVRLSMDGYGVPEIATALNVRTNQVRKALADPRCRVIEQRFKAELTAPGAIELFHAARAQYRLAKAWDVLDAEMDSKDAWIRHQAALAVIAAANKAAETNNRTEIVISPDLIFDDQPGPEMQEQDQGDSIRPDLVVLPSS